MKYKLLVLDVDGTLLRSDYQISKRTLAAVHKVQAMGVSILLSSGRPMQGLLPLAKQMDLGRHNGYILSYNGAKIVRASDEAVLFEKRINPELIPYLEKKARKHGFDMFTYHDNRILTDNPENTYIQREASLNGMELTMCDDLSIEIDFNPCKFMMASGDIEGLKTLEKNWQQRLAGSLDVFRTEDYFLEMVPCGVNKANSLGVLLDELGIDSKEVMAIGDGVADVGVLQQVGLGVAMGNAPDSVKRCADAVTSNNDEDGVAIAIEKAFLSDIRPSEVPLETLNEQSKDTLIGNLGIQFTYASADRIEATMPVDKRTRQPFGILHGGASLALAETVAGFGSMIICEPDEFVVGMQVSGNHVSSAHEGDTVRAVGTVVHKGRSSHVWNVDILTSTEKLVSSVRVINSVIKRR